MAANAPTPRTNLEKDLCDSLLVLARAATDNGDRTDLDDVIEAFGFTRAELAAELDEDRDTYTTRPPT